MKKRTLHQKSARLIRNAHAASRFRLRQQTRHHNCARGIRRAHTEAHALSELSPNKLFVASKMFCCAFCLFFSAPTHTHSHTLAHASIHNHTRAHTQHKYYYYCYYYYYSIMFIIITTLLPSLFAQHCHSHYPTGVRQHFDNNSTAIRHQT